MASADPGRGTSPPEPPPPGLPAGVLLRQTYRIGTVLGQGGFGITYRAFDERLGMPVAIKEFFLSGSTRLGLAVQPPSSLAPEMVRHTLDRFLDEAQSLARFNHPGIVRVLASFEENHTGYIVMEFLQGETLEVWLGRVGYLAEAQVVRIAYHVGLALAEMHRAGLLHQDVKPANIMSLPDGRLVLLDFGAARQHATTRAYTVLLTPGYAPPEQYSATGQRGPFSDVYSLGATLYQLATGVKPPTPPDRAIGQAELLPVRHYRPEVSAELDAAITWALTMDKKARPQSVEEFLQRVPAVTGTLPVAPPDGRSWPASESPSSWPQGGVPPGPAPASTWPVAGTPPGPAPASSWPVAGGSPVTAPSPSWPVAPGGQWPASGPSQVPPPTMVCGSALPPELVQMGQQSTGRTGRRRSPSVAMLVVTLLGLALVGGGIWHGSRRHSASPSPAASGSPQVPPSPLTVGQVPPSSSAGPASPLPKPPSPSPQVTSPSPPPASAMSARLVREFTCQGEINSVDWNPPPNVLVVAASDDRTVRGWNVDQGKQTWKLRGPPARCTSLAVSPDGKIVASVSSDGRLRFFNNWLNRQTLNVPGANGHATDVLAFSRTGTLVATLTAHGTLAVVWVQARRLLRQLKGPQDLTSFAFSPDDRKIALSGKPPIILVFETRTGKVLKRLVGHSDVVQALDFSPLGWLLASASEDGTVRLWDVGSGVSTALALGDKAFTVRFSPDGKLLAVGCRDGGVRVFRIDGRTGTQVLRLEGHGIAKSVSFRRGDSSWLAAGFGDGRVRVWQISGLR